MPLPHAAPRAPCRPCFALLLAAGLLAACGGGEERGAAALPSRLDAGLAEPVVAEGVGFQAMALEGGGRPGLLALRVGIDNRGGGAVRLVPRQTFLIGADGRAWPLLAAAEAREQLGLAPPGTPPAPGDLEALTGFAVDMLAGPAFAGPSGAAAPAWAGPRNPPVPAGRVASGVLLFPAPDGGPEGRRLRLAYEQAGRVKFLVLLLKARAGGPGG